MDVDIPPDHYGALGLPKTAEASTIKTTYKKLVLKCHPDKFPDPALKAQKQDEFHKIAQAYETLGDDESRSKYDALCKLHELRKEADARGPTNSSRRESNMRSSSYAYGSSGAQYAPRNSSSRYEERKPRYKEDDVETLKDEDVRSSSRKYDGYEAYARRSPRVDKTDRSRSDRKKEKEREERRDRKTKYSAFAEEDDSDERSRFEANVRRRNEERRRDEEYEYEQQASSARRRAEEERRRDEPRRSRREYDRADPYEQKFNGAKEYIERSRGGPTEVDARPSPSRSGSAQVFEVRRSGDKKPMGYRHTSARPKERSSRDRERSYVDDYPERERKPYPSLQTASSAPPKVDETGSPRPVQRSYTVETPRNFDAPRLSRAETEPMLSGRRGDPKAARSSKLQSMANAPNDSGYSSPSDPENQYPSNSAKPAPSSKTYYRYSPTSAGGGVPLTPQAEEPADITSSGKRTIIREPAQTRRSGRSPSPPVVRSSARSKPATTSYSAQRPPIPHASTAPRVEDLNRARKVYAQEESDYHRRGEKVGGSKYGPEDINWAPKVRREDISYRDTGFDAGYRAAMADKSRDDRYMRTGRDRFDGGEFVRPGLSRAGTYA